ncbi:chromatin-remodeling ATPase INO80 [Cajanus cajan]|uniref:chromatin-remodeling ATPase INO80 n=1 Tax=Cajanus cajan TaxID=3821 RepID=UPI00098DC0D9|nr:chromatin-remodeling ATPase INO80 [Cajanus cajan]
MDRATKRNHSFYSTLFNLEPLMNFQLPHEDNDDFDYYGSSSHDDENRDSQGGRANHNNGNMYAREGNLSRKRAWSQNSDTDDEDKGRYYGTYMTEERYRSMLGDHVQKYKRRRKEALSNPAHNRIAVPLVKSNNGLKVRKPVNDYKGTSHAAESASEWLHDSNNQKQGNQSHADFKQQYGTDRIKYEPASLDIEDGITYKIPPIYDTLASILNLPNFSDIHVEDFYLKSTLDLGSLAAMVAADKRLGTRNRAGMGEPLSQYESLQARIKAMPASNSHHKFSLKVSDVDLNSSIPEGAAGSIKRSILSEGGVLQVYYVKVLEKGDTYEIIERSLPKKQKLKKDPALIEREEMDRIGKIWINIVKRDIPKHHRNFTSFHRKQLVDAKRFTQYCQREVKMKVSRSLKLIKGASGRPRKLVRDMLLLWKQVDKEMAEVRKREEKEAADALRREQELREAKRQQQRLNFLIQQTELYSHFMQNKSSVHSSDALPLVDEKTSGDQDALFDTSDAGHNEEEDAEEAELKKEALKAAQEAVSKQKRLTNDFDSECMRLRQVGETDSLTEQVAGASNIDLQTPSTMPMVSTVQTPELFKGCLKEYQLKGLQWLVNCYEQGLNGILADEMGLGKTIQAMVFLAHLAEEKNIWGPFLVVAPASVLNNWNEELERFCPELKRLPYWGGLSERTVLRKSINPKDLYRREAKFHILITSYQLLVTDEKYFRRVKWQYMVLDEAQAIKSSTSIRWKTLLSFNCRNRLLLTGTPVQNNMAELWALLHFIMPTLFDSHEQFNEWFSKGIENHAEHGGTLNEHQLSRLHSILKPFMLRRVKKDVISELTKKTEVMVHCKLSSRQQAFYQAIKNKISLAGLFDSNRGQLNDKKVMNLMNIVIQLRKVCNHPELFERNEGSTYFYFGEIPNSLPPPPFGDLEDIYYPGGHNPISYKIPKLVYQEIMQSSETFSSAVGYGVCRESFLKCFNIFSPENVHRSIFSEDIVKSGNFGFTHLMGLSPQEVGFMATGSFMERVLFSMMRWEQKFLDEALDFLIEATVGDPECSYLEKDKVRAVSRMLLLPTRYETKFLQKKFATGPTNAPFEALVVPHQDRILSNARLLHSTYTYIPPTRAPPIRAHCSDRNFTYKMIEELHDPWVKRLFVGFARTSECNGPRKPNNPPHLIQEIDSELPISRPALQLMHSIFGSSPPVRNFDPAKLLTDSKKLQTLDILLKRLRAENHRVLLFAQMTKMLNILEDYMNYRKYKYFRLDGSSTIQDRRDMVRDFQHRNDIFVFLLSTRAGGLGINLTAADTVIFYESDWNPTLDLQAMDRAHRLGQTKDVTVYRLICKETVEEKILLRASQKSTVQNLVMTGGSVGGDILAPEDVVSLLLDDVQLQQKLNEVPLQVKGKKKKKPTKAIRINEEGDASLEDLTNCLGQGTADHDISMDQEGPKSSNKKTKTASDKQKPRPKNSQKKMKGST